MSVDQPTTLGRTPYYVLTGGLAIIFLFPLLWSVLASVSPQAGTAQTHGFGFGNYVTMFQFGPGLPTVTFNSVVLSALTVGLTLIISTLGGYAFARFKFWGRDALFLLTLSILMVPYATLLIPEIILLESFISFLGPGIQDPNTSLGALISEGARTMQYGQLWQIGFPLAFFVVILFAFFFAGDGLRDALDPKDR